jgi:hypothetical protein
MHIHNNESLNTDHSHMNVFIPEYETVFKVCAHMEIQQSRDEIVSIPKMCRQLNDIDTVKRDIAALLMGYSRKDTVSTFKRAREHTRRLVETLF